MIVSIIIPVYQVSDYVERCLSSVINQNYTDIECIIVDDCSPDDSIVKCEKLIEKYVGPIQFKILRHNKNRGLSAARNTGTDAATGDYIYYLDSDDELTPNCVSKLVAPFVDDDSIEMVQGNYILEEYQNTKIGVEIDSPIKLFSNDDVQKHYYVLRKINVAAWNKLLKRTFVIDHQLYFKEGLIFEDSMWVFYLMKYLNSAYICRDVTYIYHKRPGSIVTGTEDKKKGEAFCIIYNEILNNLTVGKEISELRNYLYRFSIKYVTYKNDISSYNSVMRLYRMRARQFRSFYLYSSLVFAGIVGLLPHPQIVLTKFNGLRKKMNRLIGKEY